MSVNYYTRHQEYVVENCPLCGASHPYTLDVSFLKRQKLILFGGKSTQEASETKGSKQWNTRIRRDLMFICPETGQSFKHTVEVSSGVDEEIHDIHPSLVPPAHDMSRDAVQTEDFVQDTLAAEIQAWVKSSAAIARDFCKTMLTTAIGAIPVYFAVVKYLSEGAALSKIPPWLGICPPIAFMCALVSFVVALRPQCSTIADTDDFVAFRTRRFQFMNLMIWVGTGTFTLGILMAIYIFIWLIS